MFVFGHFCGSQWRFSTIWRAAGMKSRPPLPLSYKREAKFSITVFLVLFVFENNDPRMSGLLNVFTFQFWTATARKEFPVKVKHFSRDHRFVWNDEQRKREYGCATRLHWKFVQIRKTTMNKSKISHITWAVRLSSINSSYNSRLSCFNFSNSFQEGTEKRSEMPISG